MTEGLRTMRLLECIPNISEGGDQDKINSITEEVKKHRGVRLLDVSSDRSWRVGKLSS